VVPGVRVSTARLPTEEVALLPTKPRGSTSEETES
jgi:hypothetical protein